MENKIYQDDLALLLGVEVRTLRQWRLKEFEGKDLYLPAHLCPKRQTPSYYLVEDVIAFCKRNPRYGERLVAATAPAVVQEVFVPPPALPKAKTQSVSAQLRNVAVELSLGAGLFSPT